MINKKDRTMEIYKNAGADMRLLKSLRVKLVTDMSKIVTSKDSGKLLRAFEQIDQVCSRAEDNMFHDHPEISNEYIRVFYGAVDVKPKNELDSQMIDRAKVVADGIFK